MNASGMWSGWYWKNQHSKGLSGRQVHPSPLLQSNFSIWTCVVLTETLLHSAILWLSLVKLCLMHNPKYGLEKQFHFSGVCLSSPPVSSQLLYYFWNQSCLPGSSLSFESITTRLHQKPQGNTEEDSGKMRESHLTAYIEMCSVLAQRLQGCRILNSNWAQISHESQCAVWTGKYRQNG